MSNATRAQDYLLQIVALGYGFDVPDIQNALTQTNYESVEIAVEYLFQNQRNNDNTNNTSTTTQNTQNNENNQNTGSALGLLQNIFGTHLPNTSPVTTPTQRIFKKKYHAYSPAYWSGDRDKLEFGDKIVLPASALEQLSRMNVQFPICFNIKHDTNILPKQSHCSVLEFTAPEGSIYLPLWMIDNLALDATGDSIVELTQINLPKGTYVQFQPHETKFINLSNPKVVLEILETYSCLTIGDTIQIKFANYSYKLDVIKVKSELDTNANAINIIGTDLQIDFMQPRDYEKHLQQNAMSVDMIEEEQKDVEFLWRMTLSPYEKILLITGYVRICLFKYIPNDIIEILIQYADYWAILEDIIKCKPYTKYNSNIFDIYGIELQLQFIPNGNPKDKESEKPKSLSERNVLIAQDLSDIMVGNGDNSCVMLSSHKMEQLGLFRGDSILIKGRKQCIVIALANESTDDNKIRMNKVICGNVGCEYGDKVSIVLYGPDQIGYASWIRICPIKGSINILNDNIRPFGARGRKYQFFGIIPTNESIADELFSGYVKPYFQDSYRPVRIGDVFMVQPMKFEFEVVDISTIGNTFSTGGEDDNAAIVAPETTVFIDKPIEKENKYHIDKPVLLLCLKKLPKNIKDAIIEFEIEIKEINERFSSTFMFSNNNLIFIQKQSKLLYTQKLKGYNQLTFGLKIKSIKMNDFEGNEVNINQYVKQYKKQKQNNELKTNTTKNTKIKELGNMVLGLQNEVKSLKTLNDNANTRIVGLEKQNTEMVNIIAKIQEEKKELEIENMNLKNKINELKLQNLNPNEYKKWDLNELIHWITCLKSNKLGKYKDVLKSSFAEQNVDGSCLDEVDRNDIMSWGIRDFKDSKFLLKQIKGLVNQTNQNNNSNEGVSTAFHK